jgi:dTDP-glucose pyrophosphorylase
VVTKAVILARGLGTRMRRPDAAASQTDDQARVADRGLKAMIPVGRPFLDYALDALANAAIERVCLVIGPEHDEVREYYTRRIRPARIAIEFAVQPEARGTADAVAAAERFAGDDLFLVVNGDNLYPVQTLVDLGAADGPAVAAFERDDLVINSNIPSDRVRQFAVLFTTADGYLERIVEKPGDDLFDVLRPPVLLSMNCWMFDRSIFEASRSIELSPRGELELVAAVMYAIAGLGARFRVIPAKGRVLDLSARADIAPVADALKDVAVRL